MNFLDDQFLDEILNQYHAGYEKTYKYIPDLITELRAAREELKAARNLVENLRLFFCSNHGEIINQTCAVCLNSPNGETCAEVLLTKIQEYDEVKNANT